MILVTLGCGDDPELSASRLAAAESVTIAANWRVIFRFDAAGDAWDVDYLDYH